MPPLMATSRLASFQVEYLRRSGCLVTRFEICSFLLEIHEAVGSGTALSAPGDSLQDRIGPGSEFSLHLGKVVSKIVDAGRNGDVTCHARRCRDPACIGKRADLRCSLLQKHVGFVRQQEPRADALPDERRIGHNLLPQHVARARTQQAVQFLLGLPAFDTRNGFCESSARQCRVVAGTESCSVAFSVRINLGRIDEYVGHDHVLEKARQASRDDAGQQRQQESNRHSECCNPIEFEPGLGPIPRDAAGFSPRRCRTRPAEARAVTRWR